VAVKQEADPPPVGRVAPRRPDALLAHALRLHSADDEELDVVHREGRRDDVGKGVHVRGHLGKGADDNRDEHSGAYDFISLVNFRLSHFREETQDPDPFLMLRLRGLFDPGFSKAAITSHIPSFLFTMMMTACVVWSVLPSMSSNVVLVFVQIFVFQKLLGGFQARPAKVARSEAWQLYIMHTKRY